MIIIYYQKWSSSDLTEIFWLPPNWEPHQALLERNIFWEINFTFACRGNNVVTAGCRIIRYYLAAWCTFCRAKNGVFLTLFRPGFFWSHGTGWRGRIPPPLLNSENIKAMTTKLKRQIVRPKMFPLRSATSGDDVIWRHNNDFSQTAAILDPPSWIS